MRDWNDAELLSAYANRQSEEAFGVLVERHIALVYSAALRQVQNPQLAEDVTQAVFTILAQKARQLRGRVALSGWLCCTAHFVARNALKAELRRHYREQEAHMHSLVNEPEPEIWRQFEPLLDEAVAQLNAADRDAVVLRFYEKKTLAEVGTILGIDPDATQKRVSRALEKLRKFFARRGVDSTAAAIAEQISANSVQAAPVALAKTVTAVAIAKGTTASISTLTLIKGALKIMAWTKAKTAIVAGAAILLTTGTAIVIKRNYFEEPHYQGMRLSAWLERISVISEARRTPMTDHDHVQLSQAQDAVRHIGVRAIPQLLKWADATNEIRLSSMPAYQLARIGFQTLGPAAQPAVPRLANLLTNKSPLLRGNAVVDLAAIGNGAADALPAVLTCLTTDPVPYIRYWAAGLVGNIGTNDPDQVIPVLASLLNATNSLTLRQNSMESLTKFQAQADRVVPVFMAMLDPTNDPDNRLNSLQYVARFRDQAKMAVPAIVACLNDESPAIRMAATNALRAIDREAAIAAGVHVRARQGQRAQ